MALAQLADRTIPRNQIEAPTWHANAERVQSMLLGGSFESEKGRSSFVHAGIRHQRGQRHGTSEPLADGGQRQRAATHVDVDAAGALRRLSGPRGDGKQEQDTGQYSHRDSRQNRKAKTVLTRAH
jgi:hypothetical protein